MADSKQLSLMEDNNMDGEEDAEKIKPNKKIHPDLLENGDDSYHHDDGECNYNEENGEHAFNDINQSQQAGSSVNLATLQPCALFNGDIGANISPHHGIENGEREVNTAEARGAYTDEVFHQQSIPSPENESTDSE